MKILTLVVMFMTASSSVAGRPGCKIPLSKTEDGFELSASSSAPDREASSAKFDAKKAWCAKSTVKFKEFLQITFSTIRHIAAVETHGFKWSLREFYVKSFLLGYSLEGKKWRFYRSASPKSKPLTFTGNTDTSSSSWNELKSSFIAKHIRIYPLDFKNEMCMKLELYGCNKTIDCTHVIKLNENQKVDIASPNYPSPYPSSVYCNWLLSFPKSDTPISLISLDFDVGSSVGNNESCATDVVKVYKSYYSFSKYLVGAYCTSTTHIIPRIIKSSSEFFRISFDSGDNKWENHRGFNLILWTSHEDVKTAKDCENSTIRLDCRGYKKNVQVTDVFYGQYPNSNVCAVNGSKRGFPSVKNSCKGPDVLPKLKNTCGYRNVCMISIERKTFPHDCVGTKALEMYVVYQCNGTERPVTSTPSATTVVSTSTLRTIFKKPTPPVEELNVENPSGATGSTSNILISTEDAVFKPSIVLIAAVAGAVFVFVVVILITCVCCRKQRKEDEKAEVSKIGIVPSESLQSKVMTQSDSLYEKIDDLERELNNVRYEAEPNGYSPVQGMSQNPLYQREEPNQSYPSYDVPITTGPRVRYVGTSDNTVKLSSSVPETNYNNLLKSPEELPSNSIPIAKYLEPPKSPLDFTIPGDRYSCLAASSVASSSGEEVYESMDGSKA